MKKCLVLLLFISFYTYTPAKAQCSICTRTAQQLGERPAKALNVGIIYLGMTPFLVIGVIGYRWWKNNRGE